MAKENEDEKLGFSELDWAELPTSEKKSCAYCLLLGLGIGLLVNFLRKIDLLQ